MSDQPEVLDLIWSAAAIGKALGLTERQAKYKLNNREIPGRKVGGRWVASRKALEAFFAGREEAA